MGIGYSRFKSQYFSGPGYLCIGEVGVGLGPLCFR